MKPHSLCFIVYASCVIAVESGRGHLILSQRCKGARVLSRPAPTFQSSVLSNKRAGWNVRHDSRQRRAARWREHYGGPCRGSLISSSTPERGSAGVGAHSFRLMRLFHSSASSSGTHPPLLAKRPAASVLFGSGASAESVVPAWSGGAAVRAKFSDEMDRCAPALTAMNPMNRLAEGPRRLSGLDDLVSAQLAPAW